MLWFKFHNTGTGNYVYINLVNFTPAISQNMANDPTVDLWPAMYHSHDECYTVTGKDALRLIRILDREADKTTPVNFGQEVVP